MPKKFELEITTDPHPDLVVELGPQNTGVGRWVPDQKHALISKILGWHTPSLEEVAAARFYRPILRARENTSKRRDVYSGRRRNVSVATITSLRCAFHPDARWRFRS